MLKLLAKLVYKWRARGMCKCIEPYYEIKDKTLYCRNCLKPAKWEGGPNG